MNVKIPLPWRGVKIPENFDGVVLKSNTTE